MSLPPPERLAEDAWVGAWLESGDLDGLVDAITAAMEARRPQLAARLVGLIGDEVQAEPGSALARARHAARLLLLSPEADAGPLVEDLDQAWRQARSSRVLWITARMRARAEVHPWGLVGPLPTTRRSPRLTRRGWRG